MVAMTNLARPTVELMKEVVDTAVSNMTDEGLAPEDSARLVKAAEHVLKNSNKFRPEDHLINLGKADKPSWYLEVKWRLVMFREVCPQGKIETELVHLDLDKDCEAEAFQWNAEKRRSEKVVKTAKGVAIFKATVHDGKGGSATGYKSENAASFPDFIEKAESGSIGRALAALGFGTQFVGFDLTEGHRLADSPVGR